MDPNGLLPTLWKFLHFSEDKGVVEKVQQEEHHKELTISTDTGLIISSDEGLILPPSDPGLTTPNEKKIIFASDQLLTMSPDKEEEELTIPASNDEEATMTNGKEGTLANGKEETLSSEKEGTLANGKEETLSSEKEGTLANGKEETLSSEKTATLPNGKDETESNEEETTLPQGKETTQPNGKEEKLSNEKNSTLSNGNELTHSSDKELNLSIEAKPKKICCCGAQRWAGVIGSIQIIIYGIQLAASVYFLVVSETQSDAKEAKTEISQLPQVVLAQRILNLTFALIGIVTGVLLIVGARQGKVAYLTMWVVFAVICYIWNIVKMAVSAENFFYTLINLILTTGVYSFGFWIIHVLKTEIRRNGVVDMEDKTPAKA